VFLTGDERARGDAAERCARWLVRLQALAPQVGEPSTVDELLDAVDEWAAALAESGGPLADKAARLGERLKAAARGLRPFEMRAGHGHYTCGQILLPEGRTAVFDWDGYDVADPGRDVARFVVELKRIGWKNPGAIPALDEAAAVFVETYLARSRPGVRDNLAFYAAAICLRLAHKDIDRQTARWSEKAEATLDEGLRFLDHGVGGRG
jgi:aminoglycoside phosphotransferase (APT) family kinase protein